MPDNEDRDARYAEILRNIAQRKQKATSAPILSILSTALDALNAAGLLAAIKRRPPKGLSVYGPKTFTGSLPASSEIPEQWVSSVMWYKPKGYQYYETLNLLGIWALGSGQTARVIVGEKTLQFNAPVFNPESYYHHIKRKFDLHYAGNASPPLEAGSLLYDAVYDGTQRLPMRSALESTLREWVKVKNEAAVDDE
ncbi:MAG: hypothetical protein LCI00_00135 [Chloroflexi bacterium]|nr:hypothetical protein [Chloroflexota bacterium]MCC6894345.1 hypothetical protein [Anaerolineae bacterium]